MRAHSQGLSDYPTLPVTSPRVALAADVSHVAFLDEPAGPVLGSDPVDRVPVDAEGLAVAGGDGDVAVGAGALERSVLDGDLAAATAVRGFARLEVAQSVCLADGGCCGQRGVGRSRAEDDARVAAAVLGRGCAGGSDVVHRDEAEADDQEDRGQHVACGGHGVTFRRWIVSGRYKAHHE